MHEVNVYHILEQNIILYNYNLFHPPKLSAYAQTALIHKYSYENTPAKDQKSGFILGYKRKFPHSEQLHAVQQTDDPWKAQVS